MPTHQQYMRAVAVACAQHERTTMDEPVSMSQARRLIAQLRGSLAEERARRLDSIGQTQPDVWRDAVYDACTVAKVGWDSGDPRKTINGLIDWHVGVVVKPVAELHELVAKLQAELEHWKENHAYMVKRNALLTERVDLPVDRIPAHAELVRLQEEEEHGYQLIQRQAELLRGVANAVRGMPEPGCSHSHHDLPELVAAKVEELRLARMELTIIANVRQAMADGAVRFNVIEDETVPPDTMIVGDVTLTGITKEFIESVASAQKG